MDCDDPDGMETREETGSVGAARLSWTYRVPVVFVVLTLMALLIVPWLVQRRVNALRQEIVVSEPARTVVMRWQFNLVREMAALSELLVSGDTAQVRAYTTALQEERELHRRAAQLVRPLGPDVVEQFAEARTLAERWHTRVNQDTVVQLWQAGTRLMDIPRERRLFEEVLMSVAELDSAIVDATEVRRQQIQRAERSGLTLTAVLGVLALLASIAVIALQARLRRLITETEHRRAVADAALAESARAAEARHRLMRGITHDVKNPLGAARGYAELLSMGVKAPLADEQRPLVEGIERSIDSALAIIADLLDLARIDSGGVSFERVETDLNELVRQAVHDNEAAATMAGHEIRAATTDEQLRTFTDPLRVRQVVDNLVSNAIKYTPAPGRITVRARRSVGGDAPGPGSWAVVEVSDTGPGIPVEMRDAIFDEFARVDERSPVKGHGLGLAVARGLARRLEGDLRIADSEVGATFVLWIPQRGGATATDRRRS